MKKYIPFLVFFALILGTFISNSKSVEAYAIGCDAYSAYSTVTGQPCNISGQTYYQNNTTTTTVYFSNNLTVGSRGNEVLAVQQILISQGYLYGAADGIFGYKTQSAVVRFQQANNLPATGIVDISTWQRFGLGNSNNNCPVTYVNGVPQYTCNQVVQNMQMSTSISGPQSIAVNQQGVWTITATSSSNSILSYSVDWGEQLYGSYPTNSYQQQTATFTHTYVTSGSFYPKFTVTNNSGQTTVMTLNVTVSGGIYYGAPTLSYLSPSTGPAGTQVTIYGTNFSTNSNTVIFGGVSVPAIYSYNGTSVTFAVPVMSNTTQCFAYPCNQIYNVSVTNQSGQNSNVLTFNYTGGSTSYGTPTISYLSPAYGSLGSQITIYGTNLNSGTAYLGGYLIPITYGSGSSATFVIPYNSSIPRGTYNLYMINSSGQSSNTVSFQVI